MNALIPLFPSQRRRIYEKDILSGVLPSLTPEQREETCAAVMRDWIEGRAGDYVTGRFLTPAQRVAACRRLFSGADAEREAAAWLDFLAARERPEVLVRAVYEGAVPARLITDRFAGHALGRAAFRPVYGTVIGAAASRPGLWSRENGREFSRGAELYLRAIYGEAPAQAVPELARRVGGLDEQVVSGGHRLTLRQLAGAALVPDRSAARPEFPAPAAAAGALFHSAASVSARGGRRR